MGGGGGDDAADGMARPRRARGLGSAGSRAAGQAGHPAARAPFAVARTTPLARRGHAGAADLARPAAACTEGTAAASCADHPERLARLPGAAEGGEMASTARGLRRRARHPRPIGALHGGTERGGAIRWGGGRADAARAPPAKGGRTPHLQATRRERALAAQPEGASNRRAAPRADRRAAAADADGVATPISLPPRLIKDRSSPREAQHAGSWPQQHTASALFYSHLARPPPRISTTARDPKPGRISDRPTPD